MSGAGPPPDNPWIPREKLLVNNDSEIDIRIVVDTIDEPANPVGNSPSFADNKSLMTWYASDRQHADPLPDHRRIPAWTEPVHPHLGGRSGDPNHVGWWWLGVHGGGGVSTLMRFLPGGADSHRWWPEPRFGGPRAVVLVCRTHLAGLERARDAATQWASADVPANLLLAGAVAVADAPGRLDRPAAEALRMLEGVVPRLWSVPWIEDLRCPAPEQSLPLPPALLTLRSDLTALHSARSSSARSSSARSAGSTAISGSGRR